MSHEFALLHTDLVDSTALNLRLGDQGMAAVWALHDRQSRDLLARWHGREVDRSDGFMVLFDRAADAAAFALDYHRMLQALPVPLRARAGLHVGTLDLRHNSAADIALGARRLEVLGLAKAVSARLMGLAQPGQTLASAAAAAELGGDAARCLSHGHWRMKGMDEPQEVFEIGDADTPFLPPPDADKARRVALVDGQWVGADELPHRLPAERDRFVGRQDDLRQLAQSFRSGTRLLTLHGPGGMGKTRLALRYAWAWRGAHAGGAWFCDLSQARDTSTLLVAMAQALDVPLGAADPVVQLGRAIAGLGEALLIVDNLEQVTGPARDVLGAWLDAAPRAQFLATSREALAMPGELVQPVGALPTAEAAELFHARAGSAHAAYRREAAEDDVEALVELLDGMPLAIELAAPRVRVMAPAELRRRLDDRFRLLAGGSGRPDRQATLHDALAWSWDLLSEAERSALAQASVFEGSFDLRAAEAVLDLSALPDAPWTVDLLQALVDKSLLRTLPDARFGLLRSVQDFAAARLADAGLDAAARARHSHHYASLDLAAATAHGCVDLDNLVLACRNAVSRQDAADAVACLMHSQATLTRAGAPRATVALAAEVRGMSGLDACARASIEWVASQGLMPQGAYERAREVLMRGLDEVPADAPPLLAARLRTALGEVLLSLGRVDEAHGQLTEGLRHAEQAGNAAVLCYVLSSLGSNAEVRGRLDQARCYFERALAHAREAGDLYWQGGVLGNLAGVHWVENRLDEARLAYEEALVRTRETGTRRWEGNTRSNLGLLLHEMGHPAEAEAELSRALDIARRMGHPVIEATVLCNLGVVAESRGQRAAALTYYAAAVAGVQSLGRKLAEGEFRSYQGAALARSGRIDEARDCLQRGLQLLPESQDPLGRSRVLCSLAETEHLAGQTEAALAWLAEARAIVDVHGVSPRSEFGRRVEQVTQLLRLPMSPRVN